MGVLQGVPEKKIGGDDRDRTDDLYVANVSLSQLSYTPRVLIFLKTLGFGLQPYSQEIKV